MKTSTMGWFALALMTSSAFWIDSDSRAEAQPGTTAQVPNSDKTPPVESAAAQPGNISDQAVKAALAKTLPEFNLEAVPFNNAIEQLRQATGVNLYVFWDDLNDVGLPQDTPITLALKGVTAERALRLILDQAGGGEELLDYEIDDGILVVDSRGHRHSPWVIQIFDVRTLLSPGAYWGYAPQPPADPAEEGTPDWAAHLLIDLITHSTAPDSWECAGGRGSARIYNGLLVVRQRPQTQLQIAELLDALHRPEKDARGPARQTVVRAGG
jgi:hypothetical protein